MTSERELEALALRALEDAYRHGQASAPFPMADCARQLARRLQPARVPEFTSDDLPESRYKILGSGTYNTRPFTGYRGCDVIDAVNEWARRHMLAAAPAAEGGMAEPVAWLVDWPDDPELGHSLSEWPVPRARNRPLGVIDTPAPESREADKPEAGQREGVEDQLVRELAQDNGSDYTQYEQGRIAEKKRCIDLLRAERLASAQQAGTVYKKGDRIIYRSQFGVDFPGSYLGYQIIHDVALDDGSPVGPARGHQIRPECQTPNGGD